MAIGPNPQFSWSYSRARMVEPGQCARRYRLQYYAAHLGWEPDAPEEARLAYRLKQLTTLDLAIGTQVHARATEIAEAIANGNEPHDFGTSRERSRNELNRIWQASRDRESFIRRPRRHPMLLERYYGLPISNDKLQRAAAKLNRCLENLHAWIGWRDISHANQETILIPDARESITYRDTIIYAAPDLVWRDEDAWEIVDFKTGDLDGADQQLAVYALCLQERGLIGRDELIRGRIVGLSTQEDEHIAITSVHLTNAERYIQDTQWKMRSFVVALDLEKNEGLPKDKFPFPATTDQCRWCPFQEACDDELQNATYMGPF